MSIHLQRAITSLKKQLLTLGAHVEENVHLAVKAVENRDTDTAEQVIQNDDIIDQMEVDIEEDGLKMLALYQPVAIDLRFIIVTIKINNDLERIGDLAVNVAERAMFLANWRPLPIYFKFHAMGEITQSMLKRSLDSLVNTDVELARQVCADDDKVDAMNREVYQQVETGARDHPDDLEAFLHALGVSRHLERIADLATNISEDVIYMASGEIVRHRVEDYTSGSKGEPD